MKLKVLSLMLAVFASTILMSFNSSTNGDGDKCTEWAAWENSGRGAKIYVKVCEYESGGSGYYKFKNNNDQSVRIFFTFYFKNGKTMKRSKNIPAYSVTDGAACYNCAIKNGGGVKSWSITGMHFEGEKGYW